MPIKATIKFDSPATITNAEDDIIWNLIKPRKESIFETFSAISMYCQRDLAALLQLASIMDAFGHRVSAAISESCLNDPKMSHLDFDCAKFLVETLFSSSVNNNNNNSNNNSEVRIVNDTDPKVSF